MEDFDFSNEMLARLVSAYDGAEDMVNHYGPVVVEALLRGIQIDGATNLIVSSLIVILFGTAILVTTIVFNKMVKDGAEWEEPMCIFMFVELIGAGVSVVVFLTVLANNLIKVIDPVAYVAMKVFVG